MMYSLYKAIADSLIRIKDCNIYKEFSPQNFSSPAFIVTQYDSEAINLLNAKRGVKVYLDILYYPEDESDNDEVLSMMENLRREFFLENFKMKGRNFRVEDHILHFMFVVEYREIDNAVIESPMLYQDSNISGINKNK